MVKINTTEVILKTYNINISQEEHQRGVSELFELKLCKKKKISIKHIHDKYAEYCMMLMERNQNKWRDIP